MTIRVRRKPVDAYQHGELREALIQAGLKLLTEGGVAALGLRAAAQLAGVSHAAPYRHFRDKDALVDAIGERGFRMLTAHMRDQIARVGAADTPARLRASGVGYVSFALQNPGYFRVIFSGLIAHENASPALRAAGDEAYGVWRLSARKGGKLRSEAVKIRGNLTTNDGEIAVNWALDGHGIVMRAEWDIARFLASGRLVQVLPQYHTPDADIYAVYPQRHQLSTRVRAFVDFISVAFARFGAAAVDPN